MLKKDNVTLYKKIFKSPIHYKQTLLWVCSLTNALLPLYGSLLIFRIFHLKYDLQTIPAMLVLFPIFIYVILIIDLTTLKKFQQKEKIFIKAEKIIETILSSFLLISLLNSLLTLQMSNSNPCTKNHVLSTSTVIIIITYALVVDFSAFIGAVKLYNFEQDK